MFLTDKRRSYNHGVLVVGQLGDAVCVLGGAEMEDIPHIFAFVAHGFGSWTNGSMFYARSSPTQRRALTRSHSPASRGNKQFPVVHFQAIFKGHGP